MKTHLLNHRRREKRYVVVTYSLIRKKFYSPAKTTDIIMRWEKRCVVVTYSLIHKKFYSLAKTTDIRGAKRDVWWLLTATYIKQFNENSPPKPHIIYKRREKRFVVVILTASYIKKFYSPAKTTDIWWEKRDVWWLLTAYSLMHKKFYSPAKTTDIWGEKRDVWSLLTASYIKQFNENSPPNHRHNIQEERKEICGGYLQPHT